jgi:hypothetical protein
VRKAASARPHDSCQWREFTSHLAAKSEMHWDPPITRWVPPMSKARRDREQLTPLAIAKGIDSGVYNPKDQDKAETDQLLQAYYRELGSEKRPRLKRKASSVNALSEEPAALSEEPADDVPEQKATPIGYPCSRRHSEGITMSQMYGAVEQERWQPGGVVPERWSGRGTGSIEARPRWGQGGRVRSEPRRRWTSRRTRSSIESVGSAGDRLAV